MTKGEQYKHLENLYSWREFARSGSIPNFDEMDKISAEIEDFKSSYGLR